MADVTGEDPSPSVDRDVEVLAADPELAAIVIAEGLDHLSSIETLVLQLETAPDDAKLLNDLFRPFHTIKGNAGVVGVLTVQEVAHRAESLLDLCRSGERVFGSDEADAVLKSVDVLTALIQDLQARLAGQGGHDLEDDRRQLLTHLDRVIAQAPTASSDEPRPDAARQGRPEPDGASTGRPAAGPEDARTLVKVETRRLDSLIDLVGELVIAHSIIRESPVFAHTTDQLLTRQIGYLARVTSDLQRNAMAMRMVPIRHTFQKMARLVRDLSKACGKSVELVVSGEDTELDRRLIEEINDPLMHMVRNSVDHGIEPADRRVAAGKRAEGRLFLTAGHQGGGIVITIADDGAGLDATRIRTKAIERGLVDEDTPLTPSEVYHLIFHPGFSTADTVTQVSGRGVGMDVVKRNIEALRGRTDIQSEAGQGTTFTIKLPLTLAIMDGLGVRVGAERFFVPTHAVREALQPTTGQVQTLRDQACLMKVRDSLIRLVRLADVFDIPDAVTDPSRAIVLVLEDAGTSLGLVVDELLGRQEVVIKSLGDALGGVPGVAGSAILGDGRVGLILDPHGLFDWCRAARALPAA